MCIRDSRDKVLKAANPASVALQYKNIIGMKRADRSALVKGMEVVYIYHDTIDEASHTSDTAVSVSYTHLDVYKRQAPDLLAV